MNQLLRIFRPEVEVTIKVVFLVALTSLYVLTFAWGYEGRQQARQWREVACSYRLNELERTTPGLAGGRAACATLDRIGMRIATRVQ
ncbi:MAG: hypothetical protein HYU41_21890 [Candidatus Rokubacteria bacterium]|nr:hypothetical protein [Candidatus Rokubacteria bacterium]